MSISVICVDAALGMEVEETCIYERDDISNER